ncbi:MAG TPA: GNAT family N-acetyltransferase [Bacillota bacterium]
MTQSGELDAERRPYEIGAVTEEVGLAAIRDEWESLLEGSRSNRPFSTWTWAATWWRHHRRGKALYLITLRRPGGELAGLAPFFRQWLLPGLPLLPVRRLRLMGAGNSDYLDLIFARGEEEALARDLTSFLGSHPTWELMTVEECPGDSPALAAIRQAADEAGWGSAYLPQEVCPYRPLPSTWDEFQQDLGKKTRKHLDYYRRRLERESNFEIRLVDSGAHVDQAMDDFFSLHKQRWWGKGMPGSFALPSVRRFHRDVARRFLDEGRLRLYLAYADDRCVASQYCFRTADGTFYYSGGFDPKWSWAGVGNLVLAHSIRQAIDEGSPAFDFLRGAEDYKYRWTSVDRRNYQFSAVRPGFPAQPLLGLLDLQNRAGQAIKERSH